MSTRCPWVGEQPIYIDYHDKEWGKPEFDSCNQPLKMRNKETNRDWAEIFGNKWDGYR